MPELGYAAIITALVVSTYTSVAFFVGARLRMPELRLSARHAVFVTFGLTSLASVALLYAFITRDFSIAYVADYSSRDLPMSYTIAGLWAGQAGSLLFWSWILSLLAVIVVVQEEKRNREMVPFVMTVTMGLLACFLGIVGFASNPFERLPQTLADGFGLNPLLRTSDMFSHPVSLLAGYVLFTIPFAFAMGALISGRLDDWWIRSTRRWTLVAWLFLSLGNLLGMVWAYRVLGWGGYWGWDPVENAAFMPWLTGTAFLHSVMIQQRRGMLKVWNMALIIITFSLCLFGTLLTRSGMLSSVHSFAGGPTGPLFLALLFVVLGGSIALLWKRLPQLRSEHTLDSMVSREATFLGNNLLLLGAAFAIFWGTIFPLISEAVRGVRVGVGPPFFSQITAPIFLGLIFLMGICPLIGWRKASPENLLRNFRFPTALVAVVVPVLFFAGLRPVGAIVPFAAIAFVAGAIGLEFYRGVRARRRGHGDNLAMALPRMIWRNKPRYGGHIVHIGVILIAMGIVASQMFSTSTDATLAPGESMSIRGYTLTFAGLTQTTGQVSSKVTGALDVTHNGKSLGGLLTSKRFEGQQGEEPVTDVGIRSTPVEDLYVILVGWTDDGKASFKVLVNPMVSWIWTGAAVLIFGAVVAVWPDRREARKAVAANRVTVGAVEASHA